MKLLSTLMCAVLGAGLLFAGMPRTALAGTGDGPAPRSAPAEMRPAAGIEPGTDAEIAAYGQRESESPEVQEFAGGDVTLGVTAGFVILVLIVLIVLIIVID
jgi:hypothetical protein